MFHRSSVAVLVAALLPAFLVAVPARASSTSPTHAASPGQRGVIVQLFEWNWNSVARECREFLGPNGYGAVQVSPPQEHVVLPSQEHPWWQSYQPVSYRIDGRRGTRAEFAAMVRACGDAGVAVYVDAVVNHMAGLDGGTGSAGTAFEHYVYPGLYGYGDFHHCGRNGDDDIENYQDRYEVQNCELVNLADLETESPAVRDTIAGYLNDLADLGVDGFRIDAAKHIPAAYLQAIVNRLPESTYVYSEVIHNPGEPIKPAEYFPAGDVTEFTYGRRLGRAFTSGDLADLRNLGGTGGFVPSDKAIVFTDNHDTQRNGGDVILTYTDGAVYTLANAFMLAWPYGTPRVMSSYHFTDPDTGPPSEADGTTSDATCSSNAWRCEHRRPAIANMVGFHNAVRGTGVVGWWDNGGDAIAFGRGSKGYLALNHGSAPVQRTFQTGLPAGTYCDVIHGDVTGGSCSGPTYTVGSDGTFTATVRPDDAVALHTGAAVS